MYTVGYSGYYGLCLISGSYELLLTSLFGQMGLMLFLVFVEEPHIQKTYGPFSTASNDNVKHEYDDDDGGDQSCSKHDNENILYDQSTGLFPGKKDLVFLFDLDLFRAADVGLISVVILLIVLMCNIKHSRRIFMVALLQTLHWAGLGSLDLLFHSK